MERETQTGKIEKRRKDRFYAKKNGIVGLAIVSAFSLGIISSDGTSGDTGYTYLPVPQQYFRELESPDATQNSDNGGNEKKVTPEPVKDNSPGNDPITVFISPSPAPKPSPAKRRIDFVAPIPAQQTEPKKTNKPQSASGWSLDPDISFYGPGFYGNRTACGQTLTRDLVGVANRDLPCGTMVTFLWNGITVDAPVVDRGPYVTGRIFDLTGGACMAFATPKYPKGHCFTGSIYYKIGK